MPLKTNLSSAFWLWNSQIMGMALAFINLSFAARLLGPSDFGKFTLVQTTILLFSTVFDFGISTASGRMLGSIEKNQEKSQIIGAWLITILPILFFYSLFVLCLSLFIDNIFHLHIGHLLLLAAIPSMGTPLQNYLREILQGHGAIGILRSLSLTPWIILSCVYFFLYQTKNFSLTSVTISYFASITLTCFVVCLVLKPNFENLRNNIQIIILETRMFGFHAYVGRLASSSTFQLDAPILGFFLKDAKSLGFYGVSKGLVSPIPLMTRSLAITLFRNFISLDKIPRLHTILSVIIVSVACVGLFSISAPLIKLVFSSDYLEMKNLLTIYIISAFFSGIYQLPNVFFTAKKQGSTLRKMGIFFALLNIPLNLSLVPLYGVYGAGIATVISNAFWLLLCLIYYGRLTNVKSANNDVT